MNKIDVSIIIPVYNDEQYLSECLDSALKQVGIYSEIICIDDSSTDGSLDTLREYEAKFSNITVIRQDHQGSGIARNKGIATAKGRYISFLDADDFYLENDALKRMIHCCDNEGLNICGAFQYFYEDGEIKEKGTYRELELSFDKTPVVSFDDYQNNHGYQAYIFNREFLITNKIEFPRYIRYQDPPFMLNAMICAKRFCVVPSKLYAYRIGHRSVNIIGNNINDVLGGIHDTIKMAIEYGYEQVVTITVNDLNNFFEQIIKNLSDNTIEQLIEISNTLKNYDNTITVKVLDEIYRIEDRLKYIEESNIRIHELGQETVLLRTLSQEIVDGRLEKYFKDNGINEICIYGAGKYGNLLRNVMDKFGIQINAIVDKSAVKKEKTRILRPDEWTPKDGNLIISNLKYSDILEYYRSKGYTSIFSFVQIVNDLNNQDKI